MLNNNKKNTALFWTGTEWNQLSLFLCVCVSLSCSLFFLTFLLFPTQSFCLHYHSICSALYKKSFFKAAGWLQSLTVLSPFEGECLDSNIWQIHRNISIRELYFSLIKNPFDICWLFTDCHWLAIQQQLFPSIVLLPIFHSLFMKALSVSHTPAQCKETVFSLWGGYRKLFSNAWLLALPRSPCTKAKQTKKKNEEKECLPLEAWGV